MEINTTRAFHEGYTAGYNQARVDRGDMTQDEADIILSGLAKNAEEEEEVIPLRVGGLTDSEKRAAIRGYEANLSFQDIAKTMFAQRNVGLMREMTREIGKVCSKAFKRQMYPTEFYGKLEE
jgi:hypothetical protein